MSSVVVILLLCAGLSEAVGRIRRCWRAGPACRETRRPGLLAGRSDLVEAAVLAFWPLAAWSDRPSWSCPRHRARAWVDGRPGCPLPLTAVPRVSQCSALPPLPLHLRGRRCRSRCSLAWKRTRVDWALPVTCGRHRWAEYLKWGRGVCSVRISAPRPSLATGSVSGTQTWMLRQAASVRCWSAWDRPARPLTQLRIPMRAARI